MPDNGFRIYVFDWTVEYVVFGAIIMLAAYLIAARIVRFVRRKIAKKWPKSRFGYRTVDDRLANLEREFKRLPTAKEELERLSVVEQEVKELSEKLTHVEVSSQKNYTEINGRLETIERWDVGAHLSRLEVQLHAVPKQIEEALSSVRLQEEELVARIEAAEERNAKKIKNSENATVDRIEQLLIDMIFKQDGKTSTNSN